MIILGPADGVPSSDGPASIGMSSIFRISAHVARLRVGVCRVVKLPALVDVLVCFLVFCQRESSCFICFVHITTALVVTPVAFVVE